jgi:hypothetical protein
MGNCPVEIISLNLLNELCMQKLFDGISFEGIVKPGEVYKVRRNYGKGSGFNQIR